MKLKLIQAGGFAGIKKMAEEDLGDYPDEVKDAVKKVFDAPATGAPSQARDKEQHYLELEGKTVAVNVDEQPKALQDLLKKCKQIFRCKAGKCASLEALSFGQSSFTLAFQKKAFHICNTSSAPVDSLTLYDDCLMTCSSLAFPTQKTGTPKTVSKSRQSKFSLCQKINLWLIWVRLD